MIISPESILADGILDRLHWKRGLSRWRLDVTRDVGRDQTGSSQNKELQPMVKMRPCRHVIDGKRLGVGIDHAILNGGASGKILDGGVVAEIYLQTENGAEDMTSAYPESWGRVGGLLQRGGSSRNSARDWIYRGVAGGSRSKRSEDVDVNVRVFYDRTCLFNNRLLPKARRSDEEKSRCTEQRGHRSAPQQMYRNHSHIVMHGKQIRQIAETLRSLVLACEAPVARVRVST